MKIGQRARLARLEGPRRDNESLRRELSELESCYLELTEEDIYAMTDEEMDHWFALFSQEDGPLQRMGELRELLRTPQQRANLAKHKAWVDSLTPEQLDAAIAGALSPPFDVDF